jgi:hypothetical protein
MHHASRPLIADPTWLPEARRSLLGLGLSPEWPEESAEAPGSRARRLADYALRLLAEIGMPPHRLVPSLEGGVCIAFGAPGRYADVQFLNSGEVLVTCAGTAAGASSTWCLPGDSDLRNAFDTVRSFLGG